jgi:hypothetical protein
VSGSVGRDCNGTYFRESQERNGKSCYSRKGSKGGAIYFDGVYWKICQVGKGKEETGWNYSQKLEEVFDMSPPLGSWKADRHVSGEMAVDYGLLSLSSSVCVLYSYV